MKKNPESTTFILQIRNDENKSWQGTLEWVEAREKMSFRSGLEMLKLIDSALEQQKEKEDPA